MDKRCPRKLQNLPCEACPKALEAIARVRRGESPEPGCPWYTADPTASYCFFRWLADNGGKTIPDSKIAQLELIPDQEVKKIVQGFKRRSAEFQDLIDE